MNSKNYILLIFPLLFFSCKNNEKEKMYFELRDLSELVLSEVRIEKTVVINDPQIRFKEIGSQEGMIPDAVDWMKRKVKPGTRVGVYSFGTYLVAFINLEEFQQTDIVFNNKECRITLPPVKIEERGRDFELKEEHQRISVYRSFITSQEKAKAKNDASKLLLEDIKNNSELQKQLTESAKRKARAYFEMLLSNWGYTAIVNFKELQQ